LIELALENSTNDCQFLLEITMNRIAIFLVLGLTSVATAESWPVVRGNSAMTGVATAKLPDQLAERWVFKCEDAIESAPAIVGNTVYVASIDKHLYAIELSSGKLQWKVKLEAPLKAAPAVREDRVYIGDVSGKLYCLSTKDGKTIWTYQTEVTITAGVNFYKDHIILGSQDLPLYSLDANGKKRWEFQIDGGSNGTPAVVEDRIFASGCDSLMHVIDANTGKEVGNIDLGGQAAASTAVLGNQAFVGTMTNQVMAIDWKKFKKLWEFEPVRRSQPFYASTAATEKLIVAGSRDRKVYALDRTTGKEVWNFVTEGMVDASPVVVGNRVYVGVLSSGGEFYVLDLNTGRQIQLLHLEGAVTGSVGVGSESIVVGTEKGVVYCLGAAK
jgi:outer membrane protein assembly factor BamB